MQVVPSYCESCGYDLQGLGLEGECPECGKPYDKESGYGVTCRSGPPLATEANPARKRAFAVALFLLAVLSAAGGVGVGLASTSFTGPAIMGGVFALMFAMGGGTVWLDKGDGG